MTEQDTATLPLKQIVAANSTLDGTLLVNYYIAGMYIHPDKTHVLVPLGSAIIVKRLEYGLISLKNQETLLGMFLVDCLSDVDVHDIVDLIML